MMKDLTQRSKFILYTSPNGDVKLDVYVQDETLWLTQKMMAELFDVDVRTINEHLQNILQTRELEEQSVIRKIRITAADGKQYLTNFYNLDAIIAVGYRVNSQRATQFRIWATQVLREYIIKGFALNDERLKQGEKVFGQDYFRELLERVRSIRSSERRVYQQITDIFAECSIDYDPHSQTTKDFFATVQNKFHFAITGHTAAELIDERADRRQPHMGLTTWKQAPTGRILDSKGKVSKDDADKKALAEYREFNKIQPIESDFDRVVKRLIKGEKKRQK